MKTKRIKYPCGCGNELVIGTAEKGDYFEDFGNILIAVGKLGQKTHEFACVINKEILGLLNKLSKK